MPSTTEASIAPADQASQQPDAPDAPDAQVELWRPDAPATFDTATRELVIPTDVAGMALRFTAGQRTLNAEQMRLLGPLGVRADWDPDQVALFLREARRRQLNPWAREIYLMVYRDRNAPDGVRFVHHIGIGGFRKHAESTGEYMGQTTPLFSGPDGRWSEVWPRRDVPPYAAKVGVRRLGFPEPQYGVALWEEYAPHQNVWGARKGEVVGREPVPAWRPSGQGGKPTIMTAKVGEAMAFRKAFPERFDQVYAEEEFHRLRYQEGPATEGPAARRRREAYEQARQAAVEAVSQPREVITVQAGRPAGGQATGQAEPLADQQAEPLADQQAAPAPAFDPAAAAATRAQLLDELAEQAEILGWPAAALMKRTIAAYERGASLDDLPTTLVAKRVHGLRPKVVETLREQHRDDEADRYQQAPEVGTVQELFGRPPHVPDAAQPPGGES